MPEVIFNGPEGRLEGRYHPSDDPQAPCALILPAASKGWRSYGPPHSCGYV